MVYRCLGYMARFFSDSKRSELFLVIIIVVLAAFLRLVWLEGVPAGWHHDEAVKAIMSSEVLEGKQRPIFFSAYTGREPLYIYLAAGIMGLVGEERSILALRLTSALVGIATVGATYLLVRELFGRKVALVAAALLALSLWHLIASRNGYRAVSQPLLEAVSVYLLWRATRTQALWQYALGGLALGAVAYTYTASRAFPLLLGPFAIWWLVTHGLPQRRIRNGLAISIFLALLSVVPLAFYFLGHPQDFSARMGQVSVFNPGMSQGQPLRQLADSLAKGLGMFTQRGDPLWRFNLAGRPVFVGALAIFFYLGLIVALKRAWKRDSASILVLLWVGVMLLPALFSAEAMPSFQRAIGIMPAIYVLPALALVATVSWLEKRWPVRFGKGYVSWLLVLVVLAADGGRTWYDFFEVRGHSVQAGIETQEDVVAQARFLEKEAIQNSAQLLVSSQYYHHPVLAQLAPHVYPRLKFFDGRQSIVFSPQAVEDSWYVFPFSAMPAELGFYLPSDSLVEKPLFSDGRVKYAAYRLSPRQVQAQVEQILGQPDYKPISVDLGGKVDLLAYELEARANQGDKLPITLVWRAKEEDESRDYVFFSHLIDLSGDMWGQADDSSFPTAEWRAGDIVVGRYDLSIRKDAPPGKYRVEVGAYDRATLERLAAVDLGRTAISLGEVKVAASNPVNVQEIVCPLVAQWGDGIRLLGYNLHLDQRPGVVRQGSPQKGLAGVTLYWQAENQPQKDYTVFVQLLDAAGRLVSQDDSMPDRGGFPTSWWEKKEIVKDDHEIALPQTLVPGDYRLIVGFYVLETGQRLTLDNGSDYLTFTSLTITPKGEIEGGTCPRSP
ncbi:MAG: glycosyltransferase family 39 protein [Chloroflexi bacterium]|nr:glycosyltransferase family 39 protein [Chloroflexota bacterium]